MAIDILHNRTDFFEQLKKLDKDAKPVFGKMSPQHVVEHLGFSIGLSSGNGPQKQFTTHEEAEVIKGKLIYGDAEIQPGIKNPMLGDEPSPLKYADLQTAIDQLKVGLDDFDKFYSENPGAKMIHPRMGPLDKKEWAVLHNKHIAHHLRQFGLE